MCIRDSRCNAISPGHILTELTQVTWDHPSRGDYLRERIAMGRPGSPEELVGMAIMLASDASSYMTGQAYHCLLYTSEQPRHNNYRENQDKGV